MKKRKLFLAILLIGGLLNGKAQSYKHAFGASYGVTKNGTGVMLSHNYFLKFHDNIETSVLIYNDENVIHGGSIKIPYKLTTLTTGYSTNLFVNKKNSLAINGAVGLLLGYESAKFNNQGMGQTPVVILNHSIPIFGGYIGFDTDYALNEKLSLFAKANYYYHSGSDLGNSNSFIGGGLRFYIN